MDTRCIQAVQVCCNVKGVHPVRERPVKMSRRKVLLHNAVAEFFPNTPRSLYLTNIGDVPVHLTKGYVIGTARRPTMDRCTSSRRRRNRGRS